MSDDSNELIDLLQTPKSPDSGSGESDSGPDRDSDPRPERRDYIDVLFITFGLLIAGGIFLASLIDRPGGIQIIGMVVYTVLIPYISSDRFLNYVPWERLTRRRSLLGHCLALGIVYGITTEAWASKPHLPDWFITSGRRPALFYYCLGGFLLALAFCECSWISKHEKEQDSGVERD